MKFEKIEISDFMGIKHEMTDLENVIVKIGKNGTGKTSFLNAVKYVLTGAEPEGEIIRKGAVKASVTVTTNGTTYTREKSEKNGTQCLIGGKKVTVAEFQSRICAGDVKDCRIAASSEVIGNLKPQELQDFLFRYAKGISRETVQGFLPDPPKMAVDIMERDLKDGAIGTEDISAFYTGCRERRTALKSQIEKAEAVKADMTREGALQAPMHDRDEVLKAKTYWDKKYQEAIRQDEKIKAYKVACDQRARQEAAIKKLQEEAAAIGDCSFDMKQLEELQKQKAEEDKKRVAHMNHAISFRSSGESLEKALKLLDTPICPLSNKLTCTTDKTPIRNELTKGVNDAREAEKNANAEAAESEKKILALTAVMEEIRQKEKKAERKKILLQQIERSRNDLIELPAKPEPVDAAKFRKNLQAAEAALRNHDLFDRYQEIMKKLMSDKEELEAYEYLVKEFGAKGSVKEGILRQFLGDFEKDCNERLACGEKNMKMKLLFNHGIHMLISVNDGNYITFQSLSGGEKAMILYVVTGLLATISGFGILILDELSVMDDEMLSSLMDIVKKESHVFDHVILSAVAHEGTEKICQIM